MISAESQQRHIFRIAEISEVAKIKAATSRREDTSKPTEYRKFYEYIRSCVNLKIVSAVWTAGKVQSKLTHKKDIEESDNAVKWLIRIILCPEWLWAKRDLLTRLT